MSAVLNCSSVETAAESLAAAVGISLAKLEEYLRDTDLETTLTPEQMASGERAKHLYTNFVSVFGPQIALDWIVWFHFTRAFSDTTFDRGLLPLGSVVDELWGAVYELAGDTLSAAEWPRFRQWLEHGPGSRWGHLYQLKVENAQKGGPFGSLIRDVGLRARELRQRDFLRGSELIEDILRALGEFAALPSHDGLIERYRSATSPTIVSFLADPAGREPGALTSALYYLYLCRRNEELSHDCVMNFDARGIAIPRARVIQVERVADCTG